MRPAKIRRKDRDCAKPRRRRARATAPKPYHHGDLRRVLIDAALQLVGEGGPDAVSVREAARRAGVSPGAPFRHFASRDALMTGGGGGGAAALSGRDRGGAGRRRRPAIRWRAFARLGWPICAGRCATPPISRSSPAAAISITTRAAGVSRDNAELIALTERTLAEAFAQGQLRSGDLKQVQIAGRALVYGFARMNIDGHFPRWGVAKAEVERMAEAVLDLFIGGIAAGPQR